MKRTIQVCLGEEARGSLCLHSTLPGKIVLRDALNILRAPLANREQESEGMAVIIRNAGPGDEPAVVRLVREMAEAEDDISPVDEHYARHFLASPVRVLLK